MEGIIKRMVTEIDEISKLTDEATVTEMLVDLKDKITDNIKKGEVVFTGDEDIASVTVHDIAQGMQVLWNTKTGETAVVPKYTLRMQFQKKHPDGTRYWTAKDPRIHQLVGTTKCMLHKEDPNRKHWDELGFVTCRKNNFKSIFNMRRHMEVYHPQEWKMIQDESADKERKEDKQIMVELLKTALNNKVPVLKHEPIVTLNKDEPPLYVSDKPKRGRPFKGDD